MPARNLYKIRINFPANGLSEEATRMKATARWGLRGLATSQGPSSPPGLFLKDVEKAAANSALV